MTLLEMVDVIGDISSYSRPDRYFRSINSAMQIVFQMYQKECPDTGFIVWDTTSVSLAVGVDEYILPSNVEDLLRVRERINLADYWRLVRTGELLDNNFLTTATQSSLGDAFYEDSESIFKYFGPYRDAAAAAVDADTWKIRFGPQPQDVRLIELVYRAKFVPIQNEKSALFMPLESHDGMCDLAIAEQLDLDEDSKADRFRVKGAEKIKAWIYNERRKIRGNERPQVDPYL